MSIQYSCSETTRSRERGEEGKSARTHPPEDSSKLFLSSFHSSTWNTYFWSTQVRAVRRTQVNFFRLGTWNTYFYTSGVLKCTPSENSSKLLSRSCIPFWRTGVHNFFYLGTWNRPYILVYFTQLLNNYCFPQKLTPQVLLKALPG